MSKEPSPAELNESAMNYFTRGNGVEAARQLQWALIGDPAYAEAWHNRALVLRALNDPFDAILCCDRAIDIDPYIAAYHNTKGICWAALNQFGEATLCYDEALEHDPKLAAAWHNKAYAAKLSGNLPVAVDFYSRALELTPESASAHLAYSSALLGAGQLKRGWEEYEYRFKVSDAFPRYISCPRWRGEETASVVLYAEQGFGDCIQFLRYAPLLAAKYPRMKVFVEVKKPMYELAKTLDGNIEVFCYGENIPSDVKRSLPIMSAPIYCGTDTVADIPRNVPYFFVPWDRAEFAEIDFSKFTVGLCWASGHRPHQPELYEHWQRKSIADQYLAPLNDIKDVTWVSLQVPTHPAAVIEGMADVTPRLYDFYDTASLIQCCDLVVSVDTSVAHLAGALGKYTLLMTPFDNCWRWLGDRVDSPWYPTMRQIRQSSPGDWSSVIERVVATIELLKSSHEERLVLS